MKVKLHRVLFVHGKKTIRWLIHAPSGGIDQKDLSLTLARELGLGVELLSVCPLPALEIDATDQEGMKADLAYWTQVEGGSRASMAFGMLTEEDRGKVAAGKIPNWILASQFGGAVERNKVLMPQCGKDYDEVGHCGRYLAKLVSR